MILVGGDVGGTKTLLGLFERGAAPGPRSATSSDTPPPRSRRSRDLLDDFLRDLGGRPRFDAVALGVAGPVVGRVARLTNHTVGRRRRRDRGDAAARRWQLLNDLEAMAYSARRAGRRRAGGAAGGRAAARRRTPRVDRRRHRPRRGGAASRRTGGSCPRRPKPATPTSRRASDREWALVRMLRQRYGRATVEHVLSGPGLVNLHRFTHRRRRAARPWTAWTPRGDPPPSPRRHGAAAASRCDEALRLFVSAYGAEAGNLALRTLATAGVLRRRRHRPPHPAGHSARRHVHGRVPVQAADGRAAAARPGAADPERRDGYPGRRRARAESYARDDFLAPLAGLM